MTIRTKRSLTYMLSSLLLVIAVMPVAKSLAQPARRGFGGPIVLNSQGVHIYLKEKGVPHIWNVDSNGHDPTHWRNNLYHFVQRIFH